MSDPQLLRDFESWRVTRLFANMSSKQHGLRSRFYRYYRRGTLISGHRAAQTHRTRLRVPDFVNSELTTDTSALDASNALARRTWHRLGESYDASEKRCLVDHSVDDD